MHHVQRDLPFPLIFGSMVVGTHHTSFMRLAFAEIVIVTVVTYVIAGIDSKNKLLFQKILIYLLPLAGQLPRQGPTES